MNKPVSILTVCPHGLGSGLVLRMMVDKIVAEESIDAQVEVVGATEVHGRTADIIVTTAELASMFAESTAIVISAPNFIDEAPVRSKLLDAVSTLEKNGTA